MRKALVLGTEEELADAVSRKAVERSFLLPRGNDLSTAFGDPHSVREGSPMGMRLLQPPLQ